MIRINYVAIGVAAIAFFLFGWLWYTIFAAQWAAALGSTPSVMMAKNAANPYPYIISFLMAIFAAYGINRVLVWRQPPNIGRAMFDGLSMGLLFFGTMMWLTYAYEHRTIALGLINVGYVSLGMAIQAAIIYLLRPKRL